MRILQIYIQNKHHSHKAQTMLIQLYYATHLLDLDFYIVFLTPCVIGYIVKITNLQIYLRNVAITHVKFNKIVVINFCAS